MGISYAVVTKVKELTEEKQYGEAFDLLQGEDIYQSLNPQFLRSCGKSYLETEHYPEAREALVKAHVMASESIRIIYDLVHLYLKMGYYTRAKAYYELYEHYTTEQDVGRLYLQYMMKKAQRVEAKELLEILKRACEEDYSDEWGFELALLYASLGMQQKSKEECIHLMAACKNSPYCSLAEALKKGEYNTDNSNFTFPLIEVEEDTGTSCYQDANLLTIEEEQWQRDHMLLHPPEAVILQMEDDDEPEEPKAKSAKKEKTKRFGFGHRKNKGGEEKTEQAEAEEVAAVTEDQSEKAAENTSNEVSADRMEIQTEQETSKDSDDPAQTDEKEKVSEKEDAGTKEHSKDSSDAAVGSENKESAAGDGDISSYIESVMQSVADIEASVAEELKNPVKYDTSVHRESDGNQESASDVSTDYQSKLNEVEDTLSPKERLEKLMRLIEEDRKLEDQKTPDLYQEEELDMDEFLTNLVGVSAITDAMMKNYHEEQARESESQEAQNKEKGEPAGV